jgi:phage terminase Nu1 subunit (DNA packaging protein)
MTSTLPSDVTAAELMRLLGCTRPRITQLEKDGIVTRTGRGRYELASVPRYIDWLRKGNEGPAAWNRARTELASERAAAARLDRMEREGQVVRIAEVRRTWIEIATTVRNKILGVASRLAPRILMIMTAVEAEAILRSELEMCLEELSRTEVTAKGNGKYDRDERVVGA